VRNRFFATTEQHVFERLPSDPLLAVVGALPEGYVFEFPYDVASAGPSVLFDDEYFGSGQRKWRRLCSFAQRGDRIGVVLAEGHVVHHNVARSSAGSLNWAPDAIALDPGRVFMMYGATHPEHRGLGLQPFVLNSMLATLAREAGHQGALTSVMSGNAASIRGVPKAGFVYRHTARVTSLLAGRLWYHVTRHEAADPPHL